MPKRFNHSIGSILDTTPVIGMIWSIHLDQEGSVYLTVKTDSNGLEEILKVKSDGQFIFSHGALNKMLENESASDETISNFSTKWETKGI